MSTDERTGQENLLTSWEEQVHEDLTVHRAWKGFHFKALGALEDTGYLNSRRGAKSVTLTEAGIEHARPLAAKYLGVVAKGFSIHCHVRFRHEL